MHPFCKLHVHVPSCRTHTQGAETGAFMQSHFYIPFLFLSVFFSFSLSISFSLCVVRCLLVFFYAHINAPPAQAASVSFVFCFSPRTPAALTRNVMLLLLAAVGCCAQHPALGSTTCTLPSRPSPEGSGNAKKEIRSQRLQQQQQQTPTEQTRNSKKA